MYEASPESKDTEVFKSQINKLHRSYIFVAVGCVVAALSALVFAVTTCQTARCYNTASQLY